MKVAIVFVALIAFALSAPQGSPQAVEIVSYDNEVDINGYKFSYETSDGVKRTEEGKIKNAGTENEALEVIGKISWVGADGVTYTIEFIANENGFQPTGAHLPK